MTVTESQPATTAVAETVAAPSPSGALGAYGLLTTSDHKTIGRLYVAVSVLLTAGSAVMGVLVNAERLDAARPDHLFGGLNAFFQMWTLYRFALVFLVVMPLFTGIALVVVPMQVGATNVAFPRAALASFWGWALGAGITVVSVFAGGGWGALDGVTADERDAIALTLLGTGFMVVSLLLAVGCVAVTVVSLRTSGMTLARTPTFAWSMLVAASVWLLTLPILVANIVIVYVDLRGRDPIAFGDPQGSGIWAQLTWVFEQPAIYVLAIPAIGIISEVVPVAARRRSAHHGPLMVAIGLLGFLSIGGWIQPAMTAGDQRDEVLYVAFGLAALLPLLLVAALLAGTLVESGRSVAKVPGSILFAIVGAFLLLCGGLVSGALRVIEPFDLLGTATDTGILDSVAVGAVVAAVAGLWYWSPKLFGRTLPEGAGRGIGVALLLGGFLLALPDVISGFFEAPDLLIEPPSEDVVDALDIVSFVGSIVVAVGALGVVAVVAGALRPGGRGAADPWSGHTLEWATASPPPPGNFAEPPPRVVSECPLLDAHPADGDRD